MSKVIAFHMILTTYGMWLPTDPRGSRSTTIRCRWLRSHGKAMTVTAPRSHAADAHDTQSRLAAKANLKFPPVVFDGLQARAVARGLAEAVADANYTVWALAVMPDHLHMLIAAHEKPVHMIAAHLKAKATKHLNAEGRHPLASHANVDRTPSPWARNYWCPFVRDVRHLRAVRRYVELNPVKVGRRAQHWKMVQPLPEEFAA